MHELSISRNVVAIVAEAAAGRMVSRVVVEVGRRSGVSAEALAFCFDLAAAEAGLHGARLEIVARDGAELMVKAMELADAA